jgi:hypothetical protein
VGPGELGSIRRDPGRLPANDAIAQQVLGAVLLDNEAYHRVTGYLGQSISPMLRTRRFAAMGQVIAAGGQATPANLQHLHLFELPALKPYGGARYLGLLAQSAVAVGDVAHQAEIIVDRGGVVLHAKRWSRSSPGCRRWAAWPTSSNESSVEIS